MDTLSAQVNKPLLLDVGGTFIKCSDGREVSVFSAGDRNSLVATFKRAVEGEYDGIGVAIPGPFDYEKGIFLMKHKFAALYGEDFRSVTGLPADLPIGFIHDVNAGLRGELERDPSLREGNVALITIGTGLGFSYAENGVIATGELGSPKCNLWDMPYLDSILEDYVSRRGIRCRFKDGAFDVRDMAAKARRGNIDAAAAFRNAGLDLSYGAQPVLEQLGIRKVLFGGQISRSLDLMEVDFGDIPFETCPDYSASVMRGAEAALLDSLNAR